jgi:hypothetical protein
MPRHTWTTEEDDFIRANHASMTRKKIAEALGTHTEKAVRDRVRKLGLSSKLSASERMAAMNERNDGNVGDEFERLVVIGEKELVKQGKYNCYQVLCRCKCGTELKVLLTNLRRRRAKSCGCLRDEKAGERTRTHGMSKTRLYWIWAGMRQRCSNPNELSYANYGRKGVTVCEEWQRFEPFRDWALANGYADDLEIDRKDYTGGYCPENCRWVTVLEQANNRSNNRRESAFGETKTVAEWARDERCAVSYNVLSNRINILGWDDFKRALTTPTRTVGVLSDDEKLVRVKARQAVSDAVKSGRLVRPTKCSTPGCDATEIEGHHHRGYDRENWLDVVWLCYKHHSEQEYVAQMVL